MRALVLMVLIIVCVSGCRVGETPPLNGIGDAIYRASYQTKKIPIVIIENQTDYYLETLLEDIGRGTIILPQKTATIVIPNILRNPSQIKIRLIALENSPAMDERHLVGETERAFPVPDRVGAPIPLWIITEKLFQ